MSEEEHRQPETEASGTYQKQASILTTKDYIVIQNRPCKIAELSRVQTGKHGRPKCNITAFDIFTGKKFEIIVPSSDNFDVIHVTHYGYHLIDISEDGSMSLQMESGSTKEYIKLPATENLLEQIKDVFAEGHGILVKVASAMGQEQIYDFQDLGPK